MKNLSENLKIVLLLGLFTIGLTACNTTRGIGEDVEYAGEKVQDAAKSVSEAIEDDEE